MAGKSGQKNWREALRVRSSDYRQAKRELSQRFLGVPVRGSAIRQVKIAAEILQNLVGVGVSEKRCNRSPQDSPSVTFYVKEKLPRSLLTRRMMLPRTIEGLTCDVVACGRPRPAQGGAPLASVVNPLAPGAQIQVPGVAPGTLGAIVRDKDGDDCLITNCHILSGDLASGLGRSVYQPQVSALGSREIARVSELVPLRTNHVNWADVGLAKLTGGALSAAIPHIGLLTGHGEPEEEAPVVKFGFKTGLQEAVLDSIDTDFALSYGFMTAMFKEVHVYRGSGFADVGDSGSTIVEPVSRTSMGLLFATAGVLHYAIPVSSIARVLPDLAWS